MVSAENDRNLLLETVEVIERGTSLVPYQATLGR